MKKYIENIEKNKLGYSIVLVAAWFAILQIADSLVYFHIDYVNYLNFRHTIYGLFSVLQQIEHGAPYLYYCLLTID